MKCVVVVGDGMTDEPVAELGGKTPLETARRPTMDRMASAGILGLSRTGPPGAAAAGDAGSLAILGYDPVRYATGCGVYEAVGLGVALGPGDVAFRLQLATVERRDDGVLALADFTGGRPSAAEAQELVAGLAPVAAARGLELHPGRGYRHLLVWRDGEPRMRTVAPYGLLGQPVEPAFPSGPGAERLRELMDHAEEALRTHPVCEARRARGERAPNTVWPWGQGVPRALPAFGDRFGMAGAVIAGAPGARGVAASAGLRVIRVPSATGDLDTDYRAKAEYGLRALDEVDFLFLHVAAPDEASHLGDVAAKVAAIERLDADVLAPLLDGLRACGQEWRMMVMADHCTPCARRAHTADPVPFAVYTAGHDARGVTAKRSYHERDAREQGIFVPEAEALLERLLRT